MARSTAPRCPVWRNGACAAPLHPPRRNLSPRNRLMSTQGDSLFACVCGDRTRELKGALYEVRDLVNSQRAVASDFAVAISGAVAESQLRGLGGAVRYAAVYL